MKCPPPPENRYVLVWAVWRQQSDFRLNILPWLCMQCYDFSLSVIGMLFIILHFTVSLRLAFFLQCEK